MNRMLTRNGVRYCWLRAGVIALVLAVSGNANASDAESMEHPIQLGTGLRMGGSTIEGFADLLIPIVERNHDILLLNPRFSLRDGSEDQANLGLVWRRLLPGIDAVVGANAWYDSRRSGHGNRFNQTGMGLEFLGKRFDARVNRYDADDRFKVFNEYTMREIGTRTDVSTRRDISTRRHVDVDTETRADTRVIDMTQPRYGTPYGSEHRILQDVESDVTRQTVTDRINTRTITEHRTVRTTRTTHRTTTTTDRLYRQFEAGLNGLDAELGVRLPLPVDAPQVRLFAGYYSFDNPFGEDIDGYKGRIEVRAGPYLTFDAEVFEDDRLNSTDYFVGFRLHVPIHGRDTWKRFREGFAASTRQGAARQRFREMVMRDVRVRSAESEPVEVTAERSRSTIVAIDRQVSEQTGTTTTVRKDRRRTIETSTGSEVLETETIRDDVTFVDADNDSGIEDGTIEKPYQSLQSGIDAGAESGNNTIFLCEAGSGGICDFAGGDGSYDETIVLRQHQVLTSSVEANGGHYFETVGRPVIAPVVGSDGAVVNVMSNTAIHRIRIDATGNSSSRAIASINQAPHGFTGTTVTDSELVTLEGAGMVFGVSGDTVDLIIRGNTVTTDTGAGILVSGGANTGSVVIDNNVVNAGYLGIYTSVNSDNIGISISSNTVTTRNDNAQGVYDYPYRGTETTITGNVITTTGDDSIGILKHSSWQPTSAEISGNNVVTSGSGGAAVELGVANGFSTCNTVVGNDLTAASGVAIVIGASSSGVMVSAGDADILAGSNMLNGGVVVDQGGVFGCTP